jgi:hypothetical protein
LYLKWAARLTDSVMNSAVDIIDSTDKPLIEYCSGNIFMDMSAEKQSSL